MSTPAFMLIFHCHMRLNIPKHKDVKKKKDIKIQIIKAFALQLRDFTMQSLQYYSIEICGF